MGQNHAEKHCQAAGSVWARQFVRLCFDQLPQGVTRWQEATRLRLALT